MLEKENGSGFRVIGFVKRKFVSPTRKFAKVSIEVPHDKGTRSVDVRAFVSSGLIDQIDKLNVGQRVKFTGDIESECLKSNNGADVMVDGYKSWHPVLTATKMEAEEKKATTGSPLGDEKVNW